MSNERKWASWKELGRGTLTNWDRERDLTIYQFVIAYEDSTYDKYIQAPTLDEAKTIILEQMVEEEVDLDLVSFLHVGIPCNDILSRITRRTKD
jgi:hypothetical protein